MKIGIADTHRVATVMVTSSAVLTAAALTAPAAAAAPAATAPTAARTAAAPTVTAAKKPSVTARGGYVMNSGTGRSLYTKAADTRRSTGSTTKIMTARVVLARKNLDLSRKVTIRKAYSDYIVRNTASSARLIVGDKVTVHQLLYGMMLPSGCDAAYALADTFGKGSTRKARVKSFIGSMNSTARGLGLKNTHFDSFDGIGKGRNYSTPRDLTKLARDAMRSPTFRSIVKTRSTKQKTITRSGGYRYMNWRNTNPLLGGYSGALGVKTGSGPEAKYCLVFAAKRGGKTVIGTVLASSSSAGRTKDAKKLLSYGFAR
ncbi:D-alanyl-D-alanine carboxypeptidase family protein [Streptomyces sp. NPDC007063]|uniref:D-alanyl-D-alanine carboxypeptidase family protein n=1 Tax=Streptomyces sp. NPDC007063 TaxID=3364772 RepID=UPI00368948FC